ncbi:MAG TPA: uroporphyrinogen decarboxylase family protein [Phycisphaerae bacterium]|nr:uroporphyrinogen decarboxylase family protein [Phycisphaerae bacterium]
MTMTKEERVLRVIRGQDVDYLPSQITFSDRTRDKEISEVLGLASPEALDGYLENHLCLALSLHDRPLFYRNDRPEMERLAGMGFCGPDWSGHTVYDGWGMGIRVGSDGFFACFHPLQKKATAEVARHMPPDVNRDVLFQDVEEAVRNYRAPDLARPGLFDDMARDLARQSGDYLVIPSGYFGIYERAYGLMGFQEFMTNTVLRPQVVHALLDKITDYKVAFARKVVEMGFKVAHHGDDLGTQQGTLFSRKTFREFVLPRLARAWQPYNDAGIPIIMHSCGCLTDFLPDLIDIGLRVLEPVQPCMDLALLKREYGKDLVFWGGIDTQTVLPFGTPEEVRQMARAAIRTLGRGGGHIIAPSQEVMNDVPIANVKALVETIIEERQAALGR